MQTVKYNKIQFMLGISATCFGTCVPSSGGATKAKEQKSEPASPGACRPHWRNQNVKNIKIQ